LPESVREWDEMTGGLYLCQIGELAVAAQPGGDAAPAGAMLGRRLPGISMAAVPPRTHVALTAARHAFAVIPAASWPLSVATKAWHPASQA
jgi:hypothetical protein